MKAADLVVTGEGRVDRTSLEGKAPGEVVSVCRDEGIRCALFGGTGSEAVPGVELHVLAGGAARSTDDLRALGERLGRALLR